MDIAVSEVEAATDVANIWKDAELLHSAEGGIFSNDVGICRESQPTRELMLSLPLFSPKAAIEAAPATIAGIRALDATL